MGRGLGYQRHQPDENPGTKLVRLPRGKQLLSPAAVTEVQSIAPFWGVKAL
jgi:hypothetical protein